MSKNIYSFIPDDAGRHSGHHAVVGHILHEHGIGSNDDIVPYPHRSQNPGSGTYLHIVADDGHFPPSALATDGHPLAYHAVAAHHGPGMNYDADSTVCKRDALGKRAASRGRTVEKQILQAPD